MFIIKLLSLTHLFTSYFTCSFLLSIAFLLLFLLCFVDSLIAMNQIERRDIARAKIAELVSAMKTHFAMSRQPLSQDHELVRNFVRHNCNGGHFLGDFNFFTGKKEFPKPFSKEYQNFLWAIGQSENRMLWVSYHEFSDSFLASFDEMVSVAQNAYATYIGDGFSSSLFKALATIAFVSMYLESKDGVIRLSEASENDALKLLLSFREDVLNMRIAFEEDDKLEKHVRDVSQKYDLLLRVFFDNLTHQTPSVATPDDKICVVGNAEDFSKCVQFKAAYEEAFAKHLDHYTKTTDLMTAYIEKYGFRCHCGICGMCKKY